MKLKLFLLLSASVLASCSPPDELPSKEQPEISYAAFDMAYELESSPSEGRLIFYDSKNMVSMIGSRSINDVSDSGITRNWTKCESGGCVILDGHIILATSENLQIPGYVVTRKYTSSDGRCMVFSATNRERNLYTETAYCSVAGIIRYTVSSDNTAETFSLKSFYGLLSD